MKKLTGVALAAAALTMAASGVANAGKPSSKTDADNNGFPDAGVVVQRHWTSLYAYDYNGDWYWEIEPGRVEGTVASVDDLDAATLSTCDYVNTSRGEFANDAFQDSGWIQNHIVCSGYDGHGTYNYLMVHRTDARFTGDAARSAELGWGPDWEYKVLTESGSGNFFKPAG